MMADISTPAPVQVGPMDDLFVQISDVLNKVVGCAASIREIAQSLPETPLGRDNVFCPELVLPEVAAAVIRYANMGHSLLGELDLQLKDVAEGRHHEK